MSTDSTDRNYDHSARRYVELAENSNLIFLEWRLIVDHTPKLAVTGGENGDCLGPAARQFGQPAARAILLELLRNLVISGITEDPLNERLQDIRQMVDAGPDVSDGFGEFPGRGVCEKHCEVTLQSICGRDPFTHELHSRIDRSRALVQDVVHEVEVVGGDERKRWRAVGEKQGAIPYRPFTDTRHSSVNRRELVGRKTLNVVARSVSSTSLT